MTLAAGAGLGLAIVTGYFPPLRRSEPKVEEQQLKTLQQLPVRGVVVFERVRDGRHNGIWKTILGHTDAVRLTKEGRYPRFSPDGKQLAFLRGDQELWLMSIRGHRQRRLYTAAARIPSMTYHPNGQEIVFLEKDEVRALDLKDRSVRTVQKISKPAAVDITADGKRLVVSNNQKGRHWIFACILPDGEWQEVDRGCSAAISPDGAWLTDNNFDHRYMRILRADDFQEVGRVPPPRGMTIDNEAWSNRPDWIAYRSEQKDFRFIWLYHLDDPAPLQVTFTLDADRPDVFLE